MTDDEQARQDDRERRKRERWSDGVIADRTDWDPGDGLFTIRVDAEVQDFTAGQFAQVGVDQDDGKVLFRPYSYASAPGEMPEFYIVKVDDGALTPILNEMQPGEPIKVSKRAAGHFTLEKVPDVRDLWLVATGTGLAPYISMLRTSEPWDRFENIVVVHGVRYARHLSYREELVEMSARNNGRLKWVPTVTREEAPDVLHGRIPGLIRDGQIAEFAGRDMSPDDSHVLLCGNPAMIEDMMETLGERGMTEHKKKEPGHITTERYW